LFVSLIQEIFVKLRGMLQKIIEKSKKRYSMKSQIDTLTV